MPSRALKDSFKSTKTEGLTSLAEAKERMQPEQKALYYTHRSL
jgi:hypothetical protein